MGLKDILRREILKGTYRTEDRIRILGEEEKADESADSSYVSERNDILRYTCIDEKAISRSARDRQLVREYVRYSYPGFDHPEIFENIMLELAEKHGLPDHDIAAARLLSDKTLDCLRVYEKKGRYFTKDDGKGYDITEFIDLHFSDIFGIREGIKGDYRPYILFFKK
jgi:hypothetical protein